MRKLTVFLLLAALAGCGTSQPDEQKSAAGEQAVAGTDDAVATQDPASTAPLTGDEDRQETAAAGDTADAAETGESIASVMKEYDDAMQAFMKNYRAAPADQRAAIVENEMPEAKAFAERLLPLIREAPASPDALKALAWISARGEGQVKGPLTEQATALMLEHHLQSDEIVDMAFMMSYAAPSRVTWNFLTRLIDDSGEDQQRLKGVASFAQIMQLRNGQETWKYLRQQLANAAATSGEQSEEFAEAQKQWDEFHDSLADEARQFAEHGTLPGGRELAEWLEQVNEQYGDEVLSERGSNRTLIREKCEGTLFEMRYLAIGKTAPDIEGEDLDGETFRLSDYRGKVVVLDFWGDW
jgi:hypothetical protein